MTSSRLRVVFMGTPDFAAAALKTVADIHDVVAVYSQPPRPAGRGYKLKPSAVHALADQLGIPVHCPTSLKGAEEQAAFAALNADIAVVAAYGLLLPKAVLDAPRLGCINIHGSLLPRWRGAAPIQRAIMAQDAETGITIMQMDEGLDTGDMLLKAPVPITATTTTADLHDALMELGARLVIDALAMLANGTATPEPQPNDGVTYAQKIDKAEARIDWSKPATEVSAHIRGLSPFPGAWCEYAGKRLKVLNAVACDGSGNPGTTIDDRLTVACGSGAVQLTFLQIAGSKATDAAGFLNGHATPTGTKFD